jgi:uncharacterized membrane protein
MGDAPIQVVIAGFQDERGADDALAMLKEAKRERLIGIQDAAVLRKDEKGKLHVKETADMGGGKGATIGGVIGGVIGAIAGAAAVVGRDEAVGVEYVATEDGVVARGVDVTA